MPLSYNGLLYLALNQADVGSIPTGGTSLDVCGFGQSIASKLDKSGKTHRYGLEA